MNENQHIEHIVIKKTNEDVNYRTLLTTALDCTRFLLKQGLAFRGHDESESSSNRGNYVELLRFLSDHDEKVRAIMFENSNGNLKYIAPDIQKDLVNACAVETINAIVNEMEGVLFSLMVDELRDISVQEQIAVVVRYVNKSGKIIERFLGVDYVAETSCLTLKVAIVRLMFRTKSSMKNLRGQGYDGASNMRGYINGLQKIIKDDCSQAYYVHCFAHQLQLAVIAVAKGNENVSSFFTTCNSLVSIIGASCKRRNELRERQQETMFKRPCETRWNSNYGILINIICLLSVVSVLDWIVQDRNPDNLGEANRLLNEIGSFDFVFHLFFMRLVLGITNDLSQALQRKDPDIVNAMGLVGVCKCKLHAMRDDDFMKLLGEVSKFCEDKDIDVPNMEDVFHKSRLRQRGDKLTNLHHYRVDVFFHVIDN